MAKRPSLRQRLRQFQREAAARPGGTRAMPIGSKQDRSRPLRRGDRVIWHSGGLKQSVLADVIRVSTTGVRIGYTFGGNYLRRWVSRYALELHRP